MIQIQDTRWHYGQRPPSQTQDYLVAFSFHDPINDETRPDVTMAWFDGEEWWDSADDVVVSDVYAWAEIPDAPPLPGQKENDGKETEHARAGV